MRRSANLLVLACCILSACGGDEGFVKCSLKNPITVDESADQWPKFRRDSQNTGTIRLLPEAYDVIAAARPQRDQVWQFPPADEIAAGPFTASASLNSAIGTARRLYVPSANGVVYALNPIDGSRVSTFDGNGVLFSIAPASMTSTPLVGSRDGVDAVVVGTGDARFFGVDDQGILLDQVWPFLADSFVRTSPAMSVDGLMLIGTLGVGLAGVCPNGAPEFAIATGAVESSPAVGRDTSVERLDGTFFIGSNDRNLRAIRRDGVIRWSFSMSAPILASPVVELSPARDQTVAVYVADVSGLISKIDSNGRPVRDFAYVRGSIGRTESSPALTRHPTAGLRLYLGSDDGNLYAIDAISGAVIWSYPTGGYVRSSPAVVLSGVSDSDPIVIVGSFDGTLYYVRDTGAAPELVGTFTVPGDDIRPRAIESSPTVDRNGSVYFGADNGRLYAVR